MKKIFITLLALSAIATSLSAQEQSPAKNYDWQFGATLRGEAMFLYSNQKSTTLTAGIRTNKNNYYGLQLGWAKGHTLHTASPESHGPVDYYYEGIPVLLDYVHYIPMFGSKVVSFFVGAELGATIPYSAGQHSPEYGGGIMAWGKAGFDFTLFKKFHFYSTLNLGYFSGGYCIGIRF